MKTILFLLLLGTSTLSLAATQTAEEITSNHRRSSIVFCNRNVLNPEEPELMRFCKHTIATDGKKKIEDMSQYSQHEISVWFIKNTIAYCDLPGAKDLSDTQFCEFLSKKQQADKNPDESNRTFGLIFVFVILMVMAAGSGGGEGPW